MKRARIGIIATAVLAVATMAFAQTDPNPVGRNRRRPRGEPLDSHGECESKADTDKPAEEADDDRLDEELQQDVARRGRRSPCAVRSPVSAR